MDNTPEASRLVLLSQVSSASTGTKVRFLGCVDAYDDSSAVLRLRERFTATSATSGFMHVNVGHILDALNIELTQVGAWINVVGYVQQSPVGSSRSNVSKDSPRQSAPSVDAILVWSTGAIKLDKYEDAVRSLQASEKFVSSA